MKKEAFTLIDNLQQLVDENGRSIIELMEEFFLDRGDILFHKNDPSDSLYIILAGRFHSILIENQEEKIVGAVCKGETVGEMGLISGEPRSLTVRAVTNARVLKLSSDIFKKYCCDNPTIMFDLINLLIARARKRIKLLSTQPEHARLALVGADENINLNDFINIFSNEYMKHYPLVFLKHSDYRPTQTIDEWLDRQDDPEKIIIYIITHEDTQQWIDTCGKRIDSLIVIAQGEKIPHISPLCYHLLQDDLHFYDVEKRLLLIQPDNLNMPRNTRDWLSRCKFAKHYHLRLNHVNDHHYIARMLSNQAIGMVFAGGGAKGWAEVGIIKATNECNLAIDLYAGTSIGALIMVSYLLMQDYDQLYTSFARVNRALRRAISWRHFTWPVISLFSGSPGTELLQALFSQIRIEDLWRPFFCVSCNLNRSTEVIHTRGLLWRALRATGSLPGLIPPMVENGELYVDGGLMNNLPIDVMRKHIGPTGLVIAADLTGNAHDDTRYNFPPILGFWQTLLTKFGLIHHHYRFPKPTENFMRSLLLGSTSKEVENRELADLLIQPNLRNVKLLDFKHTNTLIAKGYETALRCFNSTELILPTNQTDR